MNFTTRENPQQQQQHLKNKYQLSLTNRTTRCITANVLQTKVDAQCGKFF